MTRCRRGPWPVWSVWFIRPLLGYDRALGQIVHLPEPRDDIITLSAFHQVKPITLCILLHDQAGYALPGKHYNQSQEVLKHLTSSKSSSYT